MLDPQVNGHDHDLGTVVKKIAQVKSVTVLTCGHFFYWLGQA